MATAVAGTHNSQQLAQGKKKDTDNNAQYPGVPEQADGQGDGEYSNNSQVEYYYDEDVSQDYYSEEESGIEIQYSPRQTTIQFADWRGKSLCEVNYYDPDTHHDGLEGRDDDDAPKKCGCVVM